LSDAKEFWSQAEHAKDAVSSAPTHGRKKNSVFAVSNINRAAAWDCPGSSKKNHLGDDWPKRVGWVRLLQAGWSKLAGPGRLPQVWVLISGSIMVHPNSPPIFGSPEKKRPSRPELQEYS
jgi:hypothetical protein